ncbi:MAG TPA: HD domain-containing protein [Cyclobacteriaceae bacterium]|nr:HD domain-containing protein [Cyclobacteriaceae bacterium]
MKKSKHKIINDPVYGFISIDNDLVFDLIQHPIFQRLRRIRQLGVAEFVYPGAIHTRFQHALGAMYLMRRVLESFRGKGIEISDREFVSAQIAILLHDIGHGPFSHTLEETLLHHVKHESISYQLMRKLNTDFDGRLDMALEMFRNAYARKFFHQLVSSQLDIDRLDYLRRDCFFTGVMEGSIGVDRIISMLTVHEDQVVVEEKGIYSIEHFLNARRLMYWQVYLHKTSVSAERLMVNIIRRAQYLSQSGNDLPCSNALKTFLVHNHNIEDFTFNTSVLDSYSQLDDHDVWGAIKMWKDSDDPIISELCKMLLERNLFQIQIGGAIKGNLEKVRQAVAAQYKTLRNDTSYFFSYGTLTNEAYVVEGQPIKVLMRNGKVLDIAQASDLPNITAISKIVKKDYLCWPKNVSLS